MNQDTSALYDYNAKTNTLTLKGSWSITSLKHLPTHFEKRSDSQDHSFIIDAQNIQAFDSAGALFLQTILQKLTSLGYSVVLQGLSNTHQQLLDLIQKQQDAMCQEVPVLAKESLLEKIGEESIAKYEQAKGLTALVGDLSIRMVEALSNQKKLHFPAIVNNIQQSGLQALPIVGLLSFLIGVVLAYQMGLQLQTYGANIFIAYLSGMAIFREFAPLITAIIVAGRTSSAFTAQIGSMKINEEIDALETMGLSPTEYLVTPKVFALLFAFPLLIFWANLFSILGAMYMSKMMLDVGYLDFLSRLKDSVGLKQFLLGLYKAPAFALIIALVGCFQGFAVQANSDSIGTQTTKSVVQALFLIIIADAAFSVLYSWMGV